MLRKLDTPDFAEFREEWESSAQNFSIYHIVDLAKKHGITVEETIACLEYEMGKHNMNLLNAQIVRVTEALEDIAGAFGGLDDIEKVAEALDDISRVLKKKGE
ncbi:hypothetical protein [Bacillus cereus]|jgi:hypothetical protein|uniref:Uncharacterized protein n=1 Tax=Bacillus cereus TaxID=1396 RepID=A0A164QCR2_BACCE|nr:hypothetical protein [Bacillus cereus]KZD70963.1 hypothetical protein B4088_1019 [Bacillus cereus]